MDIDGKRLSELPLTYRFADDGTIIISSATEGSKRIDLATFIELVGGGSAGSTDLANLGDVVINSPADKQILQYDAQFGKWTNRTQEARNQTLNELSDVNITQVKNKQILRYNNTTHKWENIDFESSGGTAIYYLNSDQDLPTGDNIEDAFYVVTENQTVNKIVFEDPNGLDLPTTVQIYFDVSTPVPVPVPVPVQERSIGQQRVTTTTITTQCTPKTQYNIIYKRDNQIRYIVSLNVTLDSSNESYEIIINYHTANSSTILSEDASSEFVEHNKYICTDSGVIIEDKTQQVITSYTRTFKGNKTNDTITHADIDFPIIYIDDISKLPQGKFIEDKIYILEFYKEEENQEDNDNNIKSHDNDNDNGYRELVKKIYFGNSLTQTLVELSQLSSDENSLIKKDNNNNGKGIIIGNEKEIQLENYYQFACGDYSVCESITSHNDYTYGAYGNYSHAEGYNTIAHGDYSHAEGYDSQANDSAAHAEGYDSAANGFAAHAEGHETVAGGYAAHTEGNNSTANGFAAHAEGNNSTANGFASHAEGHETYASNVCSHANGHFNADMTTGGSTANQFGTAFVIGNGTSENNKSNAFSVQFDGTTKAAGTITASTTADYAELFEWQDENPNGEDRVGHFVTIEDNKIKIASPNDDYILGIISGAPFVLGNGDCDVWNGMYLRDEFNRYINIPTPKLYKNPDNYNEEEYVFDENDNQIFEGFAHKINPEYNPNQKYISRLERSEWAPVGMLGVLAIIDDGTCQVNGYCKVAEGGIATASTKGENTWRVIKRITENVVQIIFK